MKRFSVLSLKRFSENVTGWQVTERYIDQAVGFAKRLLSQRQHCKTEQIAAKLKKDVVVEEAVALKMKNIQRKLDLSLNENKEAEKTNRSLVNRQEIMRNVINGREERLREKDQKNLDFEEQISDLKANLQARTQVDVKGIEGSTYVASRGNSTRKTRRRR
ncbi:hypothetical protein Vadar_022489 [Vaccinium darrowii]|uniref:Uncharacterized protein n=1 Tax=Vaccinium darrowii TaxID=229202 RepID=A0ACB7Y9Y5_9ERIC|nr:hypothetical protein Vadar_022489 [Vaccinium darrowii]